MTARLIRGRVLSFSDEPSDIDDTGSYTYIEDGAIHVVDGRIAWVGPFGEFVAPVEPIETIDHRPSLISAGFIDTHNHFPQMQVIGSYGTQLLDWLNRYTFIEEQKFADSAHAAALAAAYFDEMIRHGTTTPVAYCTVHAASAEAYFAEAARRNIRAIGGKVMMDRNAPEALCDTAQSSFDDSEALIAKWHGVKRLHYAISPRFALTSTPAQLTAAGALRRAYPDCYVQTHLSENHAEIETTEGLFPQSRDYTGVYEDFDLLGPRTLLGHCIHLSDREIGVLASRRSVAVFCPTSNLFLGSGLFDRQRMMANDVRIAIATDIGGGTNYSMLRTLDEGYKVLQLRGQSLAPLSAFYLATLGNARALSLDGTIGSIAPGCDADLVVLNARATPAMALRMRTVEHLSEELFLLQTLGDDRAVEDVYIAGEPTKRGLNGSRSN